MKKLKWGILGTGNIASVMACALNNTPDSELIGVASRNLDSAKKFANEYQVPKYYGNYDHLIEDASVDIVYIALPHSLHANWAIKIANAKKHILCEKPCAINYDSAKKVIEAVKVNNVFFMEALMYRCHPQTKLLADILRQGVIGDVRLIEASFSYLGQEVGIENQVISYLGGGAILDVGCYPISMASLIVKAMGGVEVPFEIQCMAQINPRTRVDDWAIAQVNYGSGILAKLTAGRMLEHKNDLRIFGSKGSLCVPSPWVPGGRSAGVTNIFLKKNGVKTEEIIQVVSTTGLYELEVNVVHQNIENKQSQEVPWSDTLENIKFLQKWRNLTGSKEVDDVGCID